MHKKLVVENDAYEWMIVTTRRSFWNKIEIIKSLENMKLDSRQPWLLGKQKATILD